MPLAVVLFVDNILFANSDSKRSSKLCKNYQKLMEDKGNS